MRGGITNIGIVLDSLTVNNLRYAEDTVLMAKTEADMQRLLDIVVRESEDQDLSLNGKKTVSMVISGKEVIPTCNIKIHNEQVKQVDKFCYLESYITSNGRSEYDIKYRIAQGKQTFIKLDKNPNIRQDSMEYKIQNFGVAKVWCVMSRLVCDD